MIELTKVQLQASLNNLLAQESEDRCEIRHLIKPPIFRIYFLISTQF